MHTTASLLPLNTPTLPIIAYRNPHPKAPGFSFPGGPIRKPLHGTSPACRASDSRPSSSISDFDLYDLLGVESNSDRAQIRLAYRALQKRCHPDIAGPPGHDMAIILNEAYAVLSDPTSRFAYDKEHAKIAELRGYTGNPIYSAWFGSETEQRAVFVDELKCVGCLKCALFAERTFAVESVYGRARVVAQWADTEDKIQEAIEACPVDCISIVERSNLAALEFLMSKQPRGNVRVGAGNAVGTCVSNIFVDVEKFQAKYEDAVSKSSKKHSKESENRRVARMSAIQAIRSISDWLYWQAPNRGGATSDQRLTPATRKSTDPNIKKLRDAAAVRKRARELTQPIQRLSTGFIHNEDYWIPSPHVLPEAAYHNSSYPDPSPTEQPKELSNQDFFVQKNSRRDPSAWAVPLGMASVAAATVQFRVGEGVTGQLHHHIGGSVALDIVNSSWLQVVLAGVAWYLIGIAVVELVESLKGNLSMYKK